MARGNDLAVMSWANIPLVTVPLLPYLNTIRCGCDALSNSQLPAARSCISEMNPEGSMHLDFVTFREHSHFRMKFTIEI